ncbi:G2/mitotic-specific cyclin-B2 [Wickerhamomyces ciferrii]|uniref:G2/mitotic-specific cyclin-B2 n=1 Tax=Wickerhamomyces ciferrii (strain ATCC 14091 / BCRC 22168 / CBS 111 / JCM 3599 / NBRC 0793 / NRRL Y-1031 F-60-10) TaxID=1206466 RepID=K0KI24_WICCF|nr:G2/mitotic-specific cyclin-B2 [Wickerhamomyces ciferrii]CCH44860.1 G2/mitotic-specific cyclin-B2 [Wickerhamomyces ciferrii]
MWTPKVQKLGPPKQLKPRQYHPTLELLETEANKKATQEYDQDITNYLSIIENNSIVNCSMIDLQPEIQWYMRPYLLDFIVEIHQSFRLHPQTLFLAINIIDKYCSKRVVFKRHYQLVGCTSLWLAAKYEDKKSRVPTLKELTIMCRNVYDQEMFVQMERHILSTLEWNLTHTSLEDCLQISLKNSLNFITSTPKKFTMNKFISSSDQYEKITQLTRFFCEVSLYERNYLQFPSSIIAITSHLLASNIMNSNSALESFKKSINEFYANELSDDETFDENLENLYPNVIKPFLSGFSDETIIQIRQITILLINSFKTLSQALINKYKTEDFNIIELVQSFLSKYQIFTNQIPTSIPTIEEYQIPTQLIAITDLFLGFSTQSQSQSQANHHYQSNSSLNSPITSQFTNLQIPPPFGTFQSPLTPPSASSTISSIFSNDHHLYHNFSSTSLNPTPNTSPIESSMYSQSQGNNSFIKIRSNIDSDHQGNSGVGNKRSRNYHDEETGSSPLAQRSQNKLNMVI